MSVQRAKILWVAALAISSLALFLIGYFSGKAVGNACSRASQSRDELLSADRRRREIHNEIVSSLDARAIKENLRYVLSPRALCITNDCLTLHHHLKL